MNDVASLLALVDAYKDACGLVKDGRVSTLVFNDGSRVRMLREGGDIGTRRLARAILWFHDNWPEGADWPADVPRPSAETEAA